MNIDEKLDLIRAVESSGFSINESLRRLDVSRSTYFRWKAKFKKFGKEGLRNKSSKPQRQWNQISESEREQVLSLANLYPDWSSRELSFYISDTQGFFISESTVYLILKGSGLIRPQIVDSFPAGLEYSYKPKRNKI